MLVALMQQVQYGVSHENSYHTDLTPTLSNPFQAAEQLVSIRCVTCIDTSNQDTEPRGLVVTPALSLSHHHHIDIKVTSGMKVSHRDPSFTD